MNALRGAPLTVAITTLCLAIAGLEALGWSLTPHLALERGSLAPLRLLGAHLVHLNALHLAWNAGGFLLLGLLYEPRIGTRGTALLLLISALVVDAAVLSGACGVERYAGISGVATTLFVRGAMDDARDAWSAADRAGSWLAIAALGGLVFKLVYEVTTGRYLLLDGRVPGVAVPGVHVAGSALGLLSALTSTGRLSNREALRLAS